MVSIFWKAEEPLQKPAAEICNPPFCRVDPEFFSEFFFRHMPGRIKIVIPLRESDHTYPFARETIENDCLLDHALILQKKNIRVNAQKSFRGEIIPAACDPCGRNAAAFRILDRKEILLIEKPSSEDHIRRIPFEIFTPCAVIAEKIVFRPPHYRPPRAKMPQHPKK